MPSTSPLKPLDKIQVLAVEYNTLKTEIFEQSRIMYQIFGIGGTISLSIIGFIFSYRTLVTWILGGILTVVVLLMMYVNARMMTFVADRCSKRLLELETKINNLAKTELLVWEHLYGFQIGSDKARIDAVVGPLKGPFGLVFLPALLMLIIGLMMVAAN